MGFHLGGSGRLGYHPPVRRVPSGSKRSTQAGGVVRHESTRPPLPVAGQATTAVPTPLGPVTAPVSPSEPDLGAHARALLTSKLDARGLVECEARALAEARAALALDLERLPVTRALARFTWVVDQIIERLGACIERELGPPPPDPSTRHPAAYQLFAAGSYARSALSPFSDVDYGLLISHDSPKVREYFRRYTTRLGELLSAVDPAGALHACDLISPTGRAKDALIGTPAALARRAAGAAAENDYDSTKVAVYVYTALNTTRPVFACHGGTSLHHQLEERREAELGPSAPHMEPGSPRAKLVEMLLRSMRSPFGVPKQVPGTFGPYDGRSPEEALSVGRVNVKHDLWKALYFPVVTMASLHGVREVGFPETLRTLASLGHIPEIIARRLEEIHDALLSWRAKNHLTHGRSKEVLVPLEPHHVRAIRRMVPVLFRLEQELRRLSVTDPNRFQLGGER